ncbi:alcohol dehydrogenase catalytic domain-containing protein [Aerococcus sp. HMSC10H05]|uniref:alcohol dehydrogenase catalytic domain-containing protein n=1 Tax=Aerococcus sp. HMSC10H05 TaxID=1581084 RepID=UPI0008A5406D|nr:alcohol dehydrogenase catalytic domain-containing protein [Aerococcus sp. HMSC10H05]OFU49364.1 Zn-dependent alcohol dehydrogenase [Aerococcus sp. HMSC10H05]
MKAAIFNEPGNMSVTDMAKPKIQAPHDAIIRVVRACVCGSDLWWYRGISDKTKGSQTGHEAIGIVEEVGSAVKNVQKGDFVIVPFTNGCGHCAACKAGFDGDCATFTGGALGFQAEYLRYVSADWGLVKIPGQPGDYSADMLKSFTTLADVMATGYHAAFTAEVKPGDTVVVVGDGAVGLCGVIGAKLLGAERIIMMSRHKDRQELAIEFGATDIVAERGNAGIQRVMALTGEGADAVLECIGSQLAVETAVQLARPGAVVGRVRVPHIDELDTNKLFWKNIGLRGGRAAVSTHDRSVLLDAVLEGRINPGKVFNMAFELDDVQAAYAAMDERKAIKSLLVISE